ncbi:MAG: histidinol-phosphatase [Bowdeniella nasicola]|nr:histidinol-phosphatase [Bowdeniella nasicola]
MATSYVDDLRLAHYLAAQVDQYTSAQFSSQDFTVESKPDLTLVTNADRRAEELIREQLRRVRPGDSVLGEEYGTEGAAARQWIIDPIDGTHNFVRGVPVWATLIALAVEGEVVVGVVSAPQLSRRWWAARGHGAYTGRSQSQARALRVSTVSRLEDASLSYSSLHGWAEQGRLRSFLRLSESCWRTRAYGDFWSYMLLAEGAVDIAAEPDLEVYDMAALVPIVTEAGGTFTSLDGTPGPFGANAVATNGALHEEVRSILSEVSDPQ